MVEDVNGNGNGHAKKRHTGQFVKGDPRTCLTGRPKKENSLVSQVGDLFKMRADVLLIQQERPPADETAERRMARQLVAKCMAGDQKMIEEVCKRYWPVVNTNVNINETRTIDDVVAHLRGMAIAVGNDSEQNGDD